ncbi:uncharacterized protein LOC103576284 [Microplitis demolitor]|uniref:uncharacterized protein LOC103576284 n=1 Tax=Microplitis demolitor TaxID=69319 RepID=UPI00235B5B49|nr:uncharacterized protein LOC103576284 [Microplitis demolitor]
MYNFKVWLFGVFAIIINIKISPVISGLVSIGRGEPQDEQPGSFEYFNSMHPILINEEYLNDEKYCTGYCDQLDTTNRNHSIYSSYPNECNGRLQYCWFHEVSEKRRDAQINLFIKSTSTNYGFNRVLRQGISIAYDKLSHTGNICKCICERTYDTNPATPRKQLLDSICFDPVSVDDGYVATGVRFKRYSNVIHLQLQQGIFANKTIDPSTVQWKIIKKCDNQKKVIYNFKDGSYNGLKIPLENFFLPENAVVTGVTLGKSLSGRRIDNGNIDICKPEIKKRTRCSEGSKPVYIDYNYWPSAWSITPNRRHDLLCPHILFEGKLDTSKNEIHVVPYVDMQEIALSPPEPLRGIGWYHRDNSRHGFLALKIYKTM